MTITTIILMSDDTGTGEINDCDLILDASVTELCRWPSWFSCSYNVIITEVLYSVHTNFLSTDWILINLQHWMNHDNAMSERSQFVKIGGHRTSTLFLVVQASLKALSSGRSFSLSTCRWSRTSLLNMESGSISLLTTCKFTSHSIWHDSKSFRSVSIFYFFVASLLHMHVLLFVVLVLDFEIMNWITSFTQPFLQTQFS